MRLLSCTFVVLLASAPAAAQRAIDLTGKPVASVSEPFTRVAGVRELPGRHAIVTDQAERRVVLVDFSNGSSRALGRVGDGPGEYRFPTAPLRGPGDTTWIYDAVLRRMSVVTPAGAFVTTLALPNEAVPGGFSAARATDAAGRIYLEGNTYNKDTGGFSDSVAVVRWDPRTRKAVTLARVWGGGRVMVDRSGMRASVARTILPFPAIDAWTVLGDGAVAMVQHAPHRMVVVREGAPPVTSAVLAYANLKVTPGDRDAYRADQEGARVVASGGNQSLRMPPVPDTDFPTEMPPFIASSVLATPEGEIWVGRSFASSASTRTYDVLNDQGKVVARVTTTPDRAVVGFGLRTVYVARTDPADHLVYLEQFNR